MQAAGALVFTFLVKLHFVLVVCKLVTLKIKNGTHGTSKIGRAQFLVQNSRTFYVRGTQWFERKLAIRPCVSPWWLKNEKKRDSSEIKDSPNANLNMLDSVV